MESKVRLSCSACVFLSALSKLLLIRKSINVNQIAHHTKSLACRVCVLICGGDYSSVWGPSDSVVLVTIPVLTEDHGAYTVAYRLLLLVSNTLNFY